ncbi:hypothetical protein, partial [Pseudomonas otitidis]|uniref:hypothetical protein n=1 Tax=Metapseudomonas otitidis TaxID=319939 RepID=UPI00197DE64E
LRVCLRLPAYSASAKVICFIGKLGEWNSGILPKSGSLFQTIPNRARNPGNARNLAGLVNRGSGPNPLDRFGYFHQYVRVLPGECSTALAEQVLLQPTKAAQLVDDMGINSASGLPLQCGSQHELADAHPAVMSLLSNQKLFFFEAPNCW